jgi:hypothetical protein
MHPDTAKIAPHMKDFGLCLIAGSLVDVSYNQMMRPIVHATAVTRCAQGGEIAIKARIAQEHPLLIISKIPKPCVAEDLFDIESMFSRQTVKYEDLPDLLWASTGHRMEKSEQFKEFGKLRNKITHFAVPNVDLPECTLRFAFDVMVPMIHTFWNHDIFDSVREYDEEGEQVIRECLKRYDIKAA